MRAIAFLCLLVFAAATAQNSTQKVNSTLVFAAAKNVSQNPVEEKFDWGNLSTSNIDVCLVDQQSCGCCLMQKQMNKMEMFFNMSLLELKKDLREAQYSLNTVRASRATFSVALGVNAFGPFDDDRIIVYKYVFMNIGGGYNETDGIFLVQRSGVYNLALTIYSDSGSAGNAIEAGAKLKVNNRLVAWPKEKYRQDQHDSNSLVMALQLYQEDKVYVVLPTGSFLRDVDNSHFNTFTGFPLYYTD